MSTQLAERTIQSPPKLRIDSRIKDKDVYDPRKTYPFHYEAKAHRDLPHIVKFSGGKTSGMLLFTLLEGKLLNAERGDVVVFNNTSAEHPKTYEFVRHCKEIVEREYKIPFFWVEFQTFEDARNGEYTRLPAFRLVNDKPFSPENPDGYKSRGEVFEEMISSRGFVPTFFRRICTKTLKLDTTRDFLREWLADKESTERLGHFGNESRIEDDRAYAYHLKCGGATPKDIFLEKKKFLKGRPLFRPAQRWADFSSAVAPLKNETLKGKTLGRNADFGEGGVEYVAFIGLRYDEKQRIHKVRQRNEGGAAGAGYEGEYVYMPLDGMNIATQDVEDFWDAQDWRLELDASANLSNCTFCFLKGSQALRNAYNALEAEGDDSHKQTPCDIHWWIELEKKYGRDLVAEKRVVKRAVKNDFIGFFGADSAFTYERLLEDAANNAPDDFADELLPCDCTD